MDHKQLQDILGTLLEHLSLKFERIDVTDEKDLTRLDIVSNEASRIIGWHGETLNSLQHLLKSIIRSQSKLDRSPFLVLDIDGYRRGQEEKVCQIAEQKADFVRRTGNRIALAPMSPYFRRIVHLHVANTPALADLTTESVGEGEYRQIVMKLKEGATATGGVTDQGGELTPVMSQDDGLENLDI
jgi:spoIIIJ-associated protein